MVGEHGTGQPPLSAAAAACGAARRYQPPCAAAAWVGCDEEGQWPAVHTDKRGRGLTEQG